MLAFQLAGLVVSILPQLCLALVLAIQLIFKLMKKKTPSEKFADVVQDVMRQDPGILAMKFGDRWLVKAHGRGLHGRRVLRHELSGHAIVPLPPAVAHHLNSLPVLRRRRRDPSRVESSLQRASTADASTA